MWLSASRCPRRDLARSPFPLVHLACCLPLFRVTPPKKLARRVCRPANKPASWQKRFPSMALTTPTHAANQFHHVPPLQKIDRREYDGRMTWLSFMGVHSTSCEGAARHRGFCGQKGKQLSMYSTCSRSFWNKKREKRNLGSRRKSRWTKNQRTTASRK